jgi:hypothetical protein
MSAAPRGGNFGGQRLHEIVVDVKGAARRSVRIVARSSTSVTLGEQSDDAAY